MTDTTQQDTTSERTVVAPGGPRPATTVHGIKPGQVLDVGATARVVTRTAARGGDPSDLVITPGGPRPRRDVHFVDTGQRLAVGDRQVRLLDGGSVLTRVDLAPRRAATPALGSGWITYSSWLNGTGTPISSFTTTWTVPRAPQTNNNQVVFLFNGIEPSDYSHILQPVLQWGVSAAGGGAYWSVASWYVGGGNAFHTNLIRVDEGDVLVGVMTLDAQHGNAFDYTSSFAGIAGTSLPITGNPQLTWASETLEAYGVTSGTDYPATDVTPMTQINLWTGATVPALAWSVNNRVTDTGQKTTIAVDGASNGEVDLAYRGEAGWAVNDLTNAAGAPIAAGDPAGYTWSVDNTEHVVYRGIDAHLHELWFNGAWHHNDLTNAAGGPPLAGSDPIGYTWDVDSTQHVVYRGGDNRIHELWFNGVWNYNDLTSAAGDPGAAMGRPTGYTWSVDRTEHVVYRRFDNHVIELYL